MPCSEGDCLSIGMTHLSKRYAVGLYGFANVGLYVWGLAFCPALWADQAVLIGQPLPMIALECCCFVLKSYKYLPVSR
jgi:hypothetical protein